MERHKAGFDDSFVILHPVYVIKRYCSGVFNIAVSYISQKGPSRSYSQTMAVEFTVSVDIFTQSPYLKCLKFN